MFRLATLVCLLLMPLVLLAGCEEEVYTLSPETQQPSNIEILAFSSQHCIACKHDEPTLYELQAAGVPIRFVDTDADPQLTRYYSVSRLPTYIVIQDGVETHRTESLLALVQILKVLRFVAHRVFY